MRRTQSFIKTQKNLPKDEPSSNAQLLLRAGFIDKLMAGSFSFLPLGERVLRKVENIIRIELDKIGAQEVSMPLLHPKDIWEETGRWDSAKDVMFQFENNNKDYALGWTHEEIVLDILRKRSISYKDLPLGLYQFSHKFRNEPRSRSGLLRGVEFTMKDLYSVHANEEDMRTYYMAVLDAYKKSFTNMGLSTKITEASGGIFTENYTHEFQILSETGEDTVYYCDDCEWAQNKEIASVKKGDACPDCKGTVQVSRAIEVGNTFPFGTHYSEKMNVNFTDKDGADKLLWFASYGIGTSRIIGATVEVSHDEDGIIWPRTISPFDAHLICLSKDTSQADNVYNTLNEAGCDILYDDRTDVSGGEKLAEADLIGISLRIVVSDKTIEKNSVEVKERQKTETTLCPIDGIVQVIKPLI